MNKKYRSGNKLKQDKLMTPRKRGLTEYYYYPGITEQNGNLRYNENPVVSDCKKKDDSTRNTGSGVKSEDARRKEHSNRTEKIIVYTFDFRVVCVHAQAMTHKTEYRDFPFYWWKYRRFA